MTPPVPPPSPRYTFALSVNPDNERFVAECRTKAIELARIDATTVEDVLDRADRYARFIIDGSSDADRREDAGC